MIMDRQFWERPEGADLQQDAAVSLAAPIEMGEFGIGHQPSLGNLEGSAEHDSLQVACSVFLDPLAGDMRTTREHWSSLNSVWGR